MPTKIKHILLFTLVVLFGSGGHAQISAKARATVDRNRILIGEPIDLVLEGQVPQGAELHWFALDSIPHFEYAEKGRIDSLHQDDQAIFRQHLIITSFDSGTHWIGPLAMKAGQQTVYTDSIQIEVRFSTFNPGQDYHDIKDLIAVSHPYIHYIVFTIAAISLIAVFLVIFFLRRSRLSAGSFKIHSRELSAYEEAMKSLASLQGRQLANSGQDKLYYTALNDIFRRFLHRNMRRTMAEKTTDELILEIRRTDLPPANFSLLAEVLRMSDFVKFAKFKPSISDNENSLSIIETSVRLIHEMQV